MRQALPVGRGLGHERGSGLYGFPCRVTGSFGRPRLLLREACYELREPFGEGPSLRSVLAPETEVGVNVHSTRDDSVARVVTDAGVRILFPEFGERSDGADTSVTD